MIVKFSKHGKGKACGVLDYLLREKSKDGSLLPRKHAKILYGDPVLTEHLIDTTRHKSKYKSGYLSFSERANEISEANKRRIMQEFEEVIFCGLEKDQYDILWVEHADKNIDANNPVGRLELNFVIPCQELRTGKSFQPYYEPADQRRVNAWKNLINLQVKTLQGNSLSDPDDPKRQRLINFYSNSAPRPSSFNPTTNDRNRYQEIISNPENKKVLEEAIKRQLQLEYEQGHISSRLEVMKQLTQWGLTITRSKNKYSLSITSDKLTDKNGRRIPIRLKGNMFQKDFNKEHYQPLATNLASYEYRAPLAVKRRLLKNQRTWQNGLEIKAEYHRVRYADALAYEPLQFIKPQKLERTLPNHSMGPRF